MKFEIRTVYHDSLDEYKEVLDKYPIEYHQKQEEGGECCYYGLMELDSLDVFFKLQEELRHELIVVDNHKTNWYHGGSCTELANVIIKDTFIE